MKSMFPSHFASEQDRITKLWAECVFVVDTNVLTGLYKYSDETRDALYQLIESLGHRLWVPYQVMFEYLDNRAKVVHDQSRLYGSAIGKLEEFQAEIEAPTRQPFVSEDIYKEFCYSAEKVLNDLKARRDLHERRITNDDVKERLAKLLDGKVGPKYSAEEISALAVEGDRRYAQKIPPGFEDRDKHKGSVLVKEINKRYGDLVFWKQILDKAKETSLSMILVTGERKEDWWSICGGKIVGPLPELMDEFYEVAGKDFYIYTTHNFLKLANEYLHQQTSLAAVEEVRESFVGDENAISERGTFEADDEVEYLDEEGSLARRYDIAYYQRLEESAESSLSQMETIIQNLRDKLAEAKLGSSSAVVAVYKERLSFSLRRRTSLRMKQRYYARKVSQMLKEGVS